MSNDYSYYISGSSSGNPVGYVRGYDITKYATDPTHEQKVAAFADEIGNLSDPSDIDQYIQTVAPGSPIRGQMVVDASRRNGVDIPLTLALMRQDSTFGTRGKAVRTLNPGNVGNDDAGNTRKFGSWDEGVDAVAGWLSKHRVKDGSGLGPSSAYAATGNKMDIIDPFKTQAPTTGEIAAQPESSSKPITDINDPFKDPNFNVSAALGGSKQPTPQSASNIPESAPEWARQHPELYQNIVKTVNAFELPGDVGSMMYGAQLGATGGAVAGPIGSIVGGVAGAGLGYGINKQGLGILKQYLGMEKPPETVTEGMTNAASDVAKGMEMEMAGWAGVKALSKGAELAGGVAKNALGRLTGTGTKAVEEAIESGKQIGLANPFKAHTDFAKAMRGEITADEVVSNAKDALNVIKDARQKAYMDRLANITGAGGTGVVPSAGQSATGTVSQSAGGGPLIDVKPAFTKIEQLMKRYNVNLNPDGTFDLSRVAMGKKGRNDIEGVLETMRDWGKQPGDNTAMGLDTLKRQLDDFYSESGQARQFVTSMRNIVKKLITDNVPEYAKMTEEYAESTKLIKDLEAGLMMRKQGMTGRIVSDQTLRRLTSSMRDNFKLRGELVDMLSSTGGVDVSGQVAGHAMSEFIPRGIAGTGPSLIGQGALATYVSPYFWGVLAASSPRVSGEFLQLYGQALGAKMGLKPVAQRVLGRSLVSTFTDKDKRQDLESEMGKWAKDQLPVVSP